MNCAHCGGWLFQDREDTDYWSCLLCGRSPQQEPWKGQAERLLEMEKELYAARRRGATSGRDRSVKGASWIRTGGVRLG